MDAHARAGIDIYGRILRYAEVEQYGSRYRLLRLGTCDFDFDVVEDVLTGETDEHVETVSEALGDIFAGSVAGSIHVTLHPPTCYSFFAPLPVEAEASDRKVRLQQEAALLAGTEQPLHITADTVRAQDLSEGGRIDWVHVLAVDDRIHARIEAIIGGLPQPRRRLSVGMQGAARAMAKQRDSHLPKERRGPYSIAVGWYPDHVEYTLSHEDQWYFSNYTDATPPVDVAYFAMALLQRFDLKPKDVDRLYIYGNDADLSLFPDLESTADIEARRLNPFSFLDLDSGSLSPDFDAEAYVSCVGVTL